MVDDIQRGIARIVGNFGVSFFSPLVGGNVAESIYDVGMTFDMTLMIAAISALFVTGLSISKEASEWGKNGKKKRR
jgi:apolipoprotein N-acyltransferase|tara:strand:+ start:4883 stop:5110 length:228 start_codon:yes stop_codon:yes gene_type:complete